MEKPIVFLGDSLIEWGNWDARFPKHDIINLGVAGNKTTDILKRLSLVAEYQPEKLFLICGINDLGEGIEPFTILQNYEKIVAQLKKECPKTALYLLSVLPADTNRFINPRLDVLLIPELNLGIQKIALDNKAVFINLYPHFADEDFRLIKELSTDGLHLNDEGYLLWETLLEKYLN